MIPAVRAVLTGLEVYRKAYAPYSPAEPSQFDSTLQVAIWRGHLPRPGGWRYKV